ncbi:MAG TPA: sugar phosphate isomerase/epimerase [Candidatus Acidoferrum sp.]|nr:sugar phosphate isomerase/epimerase [Candidatus Acidoferrum sp.]
MNPVTRRDFLKAASAAGAMATVLGSGELLKANPLGLPLGVQLYSVREMLPKDYEGTLKKLAAIGYQEVEAAGFFGHTATEVKTAMKEAGLRCVSAHYPLSQLMPEEGEIIQYGKDLGLQYIICAAPALKDPSRVKPEGARAIADLMTLDDWRWNAEQFNRIGERVNAEGIRFGYHNHTGEFQAIDGAVPYDELMRLTDPKKVTMEMDCGWVVVGGANPVDYLKRYPTRISMLHVKDFKMKGSPAAGNERPPSAEMGRGSIDYRPIFEAAKKANIKHAFVEQEEFLDLPPFEALKVDADYMKALTV